MRLILQGQKRGMRRHDTIGERVRCLSSTRRHGPIIGGVAVEVRSQGVNPVGPVTALGPACRRETPEPVAGLVPGRARSGPERKAGGSRPSSCGAQRASGTNNGTIERLEHAASPARNDSHASIRVMPLEDIDPQVRAVLTLRNLLLSNITRQGAMDSEVMLGRKLTPGDADVAGDAGLGIQESKNRAEAVGVGGIRSTQLARMLDRVGRVVWLIEELKVHRLGKNLGLFTQCGSGVADYEQGSGEPAVVDGREQTSGSVYRRPERP